MGTHRWSVRLNDGAILVTAALLALAVLAVAVAGLHPWVLPLFAFPALVIYRSYTRHGALQRQTAEGIEAMVGIVERQNPFLAAQVRHATTKTVPTESRA